MHASKKSAAPNANKVDGEGEDIAVDLYPFLRKYKDGRTMRLLRSPSVGASEDAAANRGVATRDVVVDQGTGLSARLFLPSTAAAASTGGERLPMIMYVHGGSFCTESAFCRTYHNYARSLAASTGAMVVSVEYRLAPEHPVPAAYDDAWAALKWMASLYDPWLSAYGDPERTFLAGDSAGGNIVYNTAVRASRGDVDIEGVIMVHPYFWGVDRLLSAESVWDGIAMLKPELIDRVWPFVTAGQLSHDDPWINPADEDIASLTCGRVLVAVAEKDSLRDRGSWLASRMRGCAWADDETAVTLVESKSEDHGFHLYNPRRATSKILMESIVQFVKQRTPFPLPAALLPELDELHASQGQPVLGVPARPYVDVLGYGMAMKDWGRPKNTTRNGCFKIGHAIASKPTRYTSFFGQVARPTKTSRFPSPATVPGGSVFSNFFI